MPLTGNVGPRAIAAILRRTVLGLSVVSLAVFASASSASAAGCTWHFGGSNGLANTIQQGDYIIAIERWSMNDGKLSADLKLQRLRNRASPLLDYVDTGKARGTLEGNVLSFVASWSSGAKGDYKGSIDLSGGVIRLPAYRSRSCGDAAGT